MTSCQFSLIPIPNGYNYVREMTTGFLGPTALVKDQSGSLLVCKVIEKSRIGSDSAVISFVNHLNSISTLHIPNLVPYTKIIIEQNCIFMFRPYVDSPTLADISKKHHKSTIPYNQIWRLIVQTFSSLHNSGIYPSFIKPSNIFITSNRNVLIVDLYQPPQDIDLMVHSPNPFDIGFLAPEFFLKSVRATMAADVWSLGILLIYMFTGSLPWSTKNVFTMLNQITLGQLNDLTNSELLPAPVKYLVSKFVQVDPSKRPTLSSFLDDVDNICIFDEIDDVARMRNHTKPNDPNQVHLTRLVSLPNAPMPPLTTNNLMRNESAPPSTKYHNKPNRKNLFLQTTTSNERNHKPITYHSTMSMLKSPTNLAPRICVVRCRVADPLANILVK